jgi:hypothetical protein
MYPYLRCYQQAWVLSLNQMRQFDVPLRARLGYGIKSGNLAASFLGLSIRSGPEPIRLSSELGMLAAMFDLVSDGLHFDPCATHLYCKLARDTLDPPVADILLQLLERKAKHAFAHGGLDRGIDAFRVVIKHLRSEEVWQNPADVALTGTLLQVVDDVLDYGHDIRYGELNFLRDRELQDHLVDLVEWDFATCFADSKYPAVLFHAIKRAKTISTRLISESRSHQSRDPAQA